jgi:hypothetical protein
MTGERVRDVSFLYVLALQLLFRIPAETAIGSHQASRGPGILFELPFEPADGD